MGCQQLPKTHENGGKDRDLLCVGALLEAWRVMFYTRWKHMVVCMMILLTDKAAQVINQWEIVYNSWLRIWSIYDRDIWNIFYF